MFLLIWTVFSVERCGPWVSCLKPAVSFHMIQKIVCLIYCLFDWLINQFVDGLVIYAVSAVFQWISDEIHQKEMHFLSQVYMSGALRSQGLHKGLPAQVENYVNIISDVRVHKLKKLKYFIFGFIFNWHFLRTNEVCGIDIKLNEWRT